jgi:putative acetyltransferase
MSVVPSQSHRGIGAELLGAAVQAARALDFPAIVVAGQPEYYARFGFQPGSNWQMQCTPPVPVELLTAMELSKGALRAGGRVIYPAPFAAIF